MFSIGIDCAKDKHDCCIIDTNNPSFSFRISNNQSGFLNLKGQIDKICGKEEIKIGLESTGHFSANLTMFLTNLYPNVIVLNPLSLSRLKNASSLRRTKTDKTDARFIADIIVSDGFKPYQKQSYQISNLKSLTRAYSQINKELQITKNHYRKQIHINFPEIEDIFSNLYSDVALNFFNKYPSPQTVKRVHIQTLENFLKEHSHGKCGKRTAIKIKETSSVSISLCNSADCTSLQLISSRIILLENQKQTLLDNIEELMNQINSPITTILGIGLVIGATILAEIGNINLFNSPNQIQAFAGFDPSVYQFGQFTANTNHIVKHGSPYLRCALFQAVAMSYIHSKSMHEYISKKMDQGKHYYNAIGHGVKKLIRIIFCVLKNNKPYSEPINNCI